MDYTPLIKDASTDLKSVSTEHDFNRVKAKYLGKNGIVTLQLKKIKDIPAEDRKSFAQNINLLKNQLIDLFEQHQLILNKNGATKNISYEAALSMDGFSGSAHPTELALNDISNFFLGNGFIVESGPEIENDFYNFTSLNIPHDHPARAMHDTFYFENGDLLRTHTSPVQIRSIEKNGVPIKVIAPGAVYRCDYDITHSPMFHQVEGLVIDRGINFAQLKGVIYSFLECYFERKVELRFRPSYFPFTEPSAEVDIKSSKGKWLEVLGCGMVHTNVLKSLNINPKIYSGYAFGLGVERLAMLKYDISDLRLFFENDLRFLSQFQ